MLQGAPIRCISKFENLYPYSLLKINSLIVGIDCDGHHHLAFIHYVTVCAAELCPAYDKYNVD